MTTHTGYILHRRNYRESSLILETFTADEGRISILCKGVKKKKAINYCLRPFVQLSMELVELGDLSILKDAEMIQRPYDLKNNQLIAGMYLNELLYRLLDKHECVSSLYQLYEDTLDAISCHTKFSLYIRQFEYKLLSELGYGFQLDYDTKDEPIQKNQFYQFHPAEGFTLVRNFYQRKDVFQGEVLQQIAHWDLQSVEMQQACKRLLQIALRPLVGDKPLMSTELLKQKQILLSGVIE